MPLWSVVSRVVSTSPSLVRLLVHTQHRCSSTAPNAEHSVRRRPQSIKGQRQLQVARFPARVLPQFHINHGCCGEICTAAYLTRAAAESPTLATHSWSPCTTASVQVVPHSSRRSCDCKAGRVTSKPGTISVCVCQLNPPHDKLQAGTQHMLSRCCCVNSSAPCPAQYTQSVWQGVE